jgi:ATP phosphoribosyltransferase
VLRLVLPKGSLERATLELFEAADLRVHRGSSVAYKATIDDPRIGEVWILRPQEIPRYVAEGKFDLGIAGRDFVDETASDVVNLGELRYSKNTDNPFRIVLAVPAGAPWQTAADLPQGVRVSTEYPELTRRYFEQLGIDAEIELSYGATEAKAPEFVDVVVDGTETGSALRAAGLRILDTVLVSYTALIANPASVEDAGKRHAMAQIQTLLDGVLEARGMVLLKLNCSEADLQRVVDVLPSMKSPTVSKLYGDGGYAVESVVAKAGINILIPALKDAGATDLLELPLSKIVH